jgi:transposase
MRRQSSRSAGAQVSPSRAKLFHEEPEAGNLHVRDCVARQDILLVLDGAPNHRCGDLAVPNNITLLYLPPYSPELNPKENLWDEIREKIFKNYALKSMDAVRAKLKQAILYIERNPKLVRSISSFPYQWSGSSIRPRPVGLTRHCPPFSAG